MSQLWCYITPRGGISPAKRNVKYKQLAINAWNTREPVVDVINHITQEITNLAKMREDSYKKGDYSRSDRAAERLCEAQYCRRIVEEEL